MGTEDDRGKMARRRAEILTEMERKHPTLVRILRGLDSANAALRARNNELDRQIREETDRQIAKQGGRRH